MKLIKNLLLAVFNNTNDAERNKVMVVRSEADLGKLIKDAQQSKLNPMAFSGTIPFCLHGKVDSGLGIDEDNIIGTLCNFNILKSQASEETQTIFYVTADVMIDENYYMLLSSAITPVEGGQFNALQSDMVSFGLKGINSTVGQNIDEIMQIITFDLILNTGRKTEAPIIDNSTASIETAAAGDLDAEVVLPGVVVDTIAPVVEEKKKTTRAPRNTNKPKEKNLLD